MNNFDDEDSELVKKQLEGMNKTLDAPYENAKRTFSNILSSPEANIPTGPTSREIEETNRLKAIEEASELRKVGQMKASSPQGAQFLGEQAQRIKASDLANQMKQLKDLEDVGAFEEPDSEVNKRAAKLRGLLGQR